MKITSRTISKAKKGDRKAIRLLYEQTVGQLTLVCYRYICNKEDVKDILQEAYIKIFSSLKDFEGEDGKAFQGWCSRITVNHIISTLRKKKNEIVFNEDILPEIIAEEPPPEEEQIQDLTKEDILKAMKELPPGYRLILNLYLFEEKTHVQIAGMLGISEGTSASQYFRAKRLLASIIKRNISKDSTS